MRSMFAFMKPLFQPVAAAIRAEFDRRFPQRHAVVVDITMFHGGDRWGQHPKRVYGVARFHFTAYWMCQRWVAKHEYGRASVVSLEKMPEVRARLGYDHWVDVWGDPLNDRGLPLAA